MMRYIALLLIAFTQLEPGTKRFLIRRFVLVRRIADDLDFKVLTTRVLALNLSLRSRLGLCEGA